MTVSTNEMKRVYDRYRPEKDILILKNSFDERLWKFRSTEKRASAKRVLWRGSKHHQRDLLENKDAILRACREFPDFEFYFVGWKPWYIIDEVENAFSVSPMDVIAFHKCLHSIHPDIVMAPLADNLFNRCKSNIAAIEGAMACGMILARDWEEWRMPGVHNYVNFEESLISACARVKEGAHESDVEATWNHVREEFSIDRWNHKRMAIIDALVGESCIEDIIRQDQDLTRR